MSAPFSILTNNNNTNNNNDDDDTSSKTGSSYNDDFSIFRTYRGVDSSVKFVEMLIK